MGPGEALVLIDGTDTQFHCGFDEAILDAALMAGIDLPHQCRGASCGTCKCEVLEGEVEHGWALGLAITDAEQAGGRCLACQARPRTPRLRIRPVQTMAAAGSAVSEVTALRLPEGQGGLDPLTG